MPRSSGVVFFDVDGVLIDSLPQHLQICKDKALEFHLDLKIPSEEEFRQMVSRGRKVSPMREFFLAVGFPEPLAGRAAADYEKDFGARYKPQTFEGVDAMLRALHGVNRTLGLVTSNIRKNVVPVMAESIGLFDEKCLYFYDTYPVPPSKSWCLVHGSHALGVAPSGCIYVGDQPADAEAAFEAGVQFLGVTYGWGILEEEARFPTANSIEEIPERIARMDARESKV